LIVALAGKVVSMPRAWANFTTANTVGAEIGLGNSTLAIIDVDYNTAYRLSTGQTPTKIGNSDETHVDCYL